MDLFVSSDGGMEPPNRLGSLVHWLRLALSVSPNIVDVCLPSPEDRNNYSFLNVVFFSYLEFLILKKAWSPVVLTVVHQRQNS
jgi:hypothetical protein